MELEKMQVPCSSLEFDFNSGRTTPCGSSPSTPRRFGDEYYFSAPTSPAPSSPIWMSSMIHGGVDGHDYIASNNNERGLYVTNKKSKSPLVAEKHSEGGDNSMINSSNHLSNGGKHKFETIRSPLLSPQSPSSTKFHHNKKKFWSPFSPKRKKEPQSDETIILDNNKETRTKQGKHRETRGRQVTRSLSPLRVSMYPWEEEEGQNSTQINSISKPPSPTLSLSKSSKGSRKWRLKDLLLFRSASEGRALDIKDPLKKYSYMQWQHELNKSSMISQSMQGSNNNNNILSPRKGPISAHELHYTVNKAISQDMKKKSFLPYKQGILGRLAINPTVHALAHGFGSLS
ncbi:Soluble guanylate cyclase 88E [Bienertia sinuspersici]